MADSDSVLGSQDTRQQAMIFDCYALSRKHSKTEENEEKQCVDKVKVSFVDRILSEEGYQNYF